MADSRLRNGAPVLLLAALLAGCAVNPVTGERELALISEEQEIAMGSSAAEQVQMSLGLVEDGRVQQYVERVGLELARTSERPELPWSFGVVDEPTPNAFALPGGKIFVTRGLLALLDSEAELAAVLGHEIGHVTARHSVNQLSRAQLAQLGLGIGMIVEPELQRFGDLANTGLSLLFLKYGREDERQSDELGFNYMLQNGYDVNEMAGVFAALQASSELAGASEVPTWLASHPSPPDRLEAVRERIAALDAPQRDATVGTESYLASIDGLVYGADPRNGYFEDGMFYHPELGFQFLVPDAWQKQNLAQAVVAVSPEQDAAAQLTITQGTPSEAAQALLRTEGIVELGSDRTRLNGREAVVSEFAAETEQGVVRGIVAHVRLGDVTYRLLTYAGEGAFRARERLLGEIVGSFAPLTSGAALDVEARRLEIVELDSDMTLDEFARRYPSQVGIEELAVINQVDGAGSVLRAGTAAKRVI